jgi:hypothetical protein
MVDRSAGASLVVLYAMTPADSIRSDLWQGCLRVAVQAHRDVQAQQPVQQRLVAAAVAIAAVHMAVVLEEVTQLSRAHWGVPDHGNAEHQLSEFVAASCRLRVGSTDRTFEAQCRCAVELGDEMGYWSVAEIVAVARVHIHLVGLHNVSIAAAQAALESERIVVVPDSNANGAVIAHSHQVEGTFVDGCCP